MRKSLNLHAWIYFLCCPILGHFAFAAGSSPNGIALEKFKSSNVYLSTQLEHGHDTAIYYGTPPDKQLAMMIKLERLSEENFVSLYFTLWSIVGAKGLEGIYNEYGNMVDVLNEQWPLFRNDPNLQNFSTPCTEMGFFPDSMSQEIRPIGERDIIVFGLTHRAKYKMEAGRIYGINIVSWEDMQEEMTALNQLYEPDLLADMNSRSQLAHIQTGSIKEIRVEHIPAPDYHSEAFFENAYRLLSDDGVLIINKATADSMVKIPYEIQNMREFYRKHRFDIISSFSLPRNEGARDDLPHPCEGMNGVVYFLKKMI